MNTYDLTLAAEEDLRAIWRYTYETWGIEQAETYLEQITTCCESVGEGRHARNHPVSCLRTFESIDANITTSFG